MVKDHLPRVRIRRGNWISGVSDGLTLPCGICGRVPKFDYHVEDDFWERIVPRKYRRGVICLACLDEMANKRGEDLSKFLEFVQFTGRGKTIELLPTRVFEYRENKK